jgi:uncharacterized RDD family membrane protein YckC
MVLKILLLCANIFIHSRGSYCVTSANSNNQAWIKREPTMNATKCPSCDAFNAAGTRLCPNCKTSLRDTGPYQPPASRSEGALVSNYAFAGFWKRLIAYLIDVVIYTLIFAVFVYFLGGSALNSLRQSSGSQLEIFAIYGFYFTGWWLYHSVLESSTLQASLGKKLLAMKVTDMQGQPIGFAHATGRHFARFINQMTFAIGFLMAAFTARKQALHDIIASTLVVNGRYGPAQIKVASENPGSGMSIGAIIGVVFLFLLIPIGIILVAIAVPTYHQYTSRVQLVDAINDSKVLQYPIIEHANSTGYWPNTLEQLNLAASLLNNEKYEVVLSKDGVYQIVFKQPELLADRRVTFAPMLQKDGSYQWSCTSEDINQDYLPRSCRN